MGLHMPLDKHLWCMAESHCAQPCAIDMSTCGVVFDALPSCCWTGWNGQSFQMYEWGP